MKCHRCNSEFQPTGKKINVGIRGSRYQVYGYHCGRFIVQFATESDYKSAPSHLNK